MTSRAFSLPRSTVVAVTAVVVLAPVLLIFWQSFLNAPFFNPAWRFGLGSYAFIFDDPDFWSALLNSVVIATGMAADRAAARRRARVPADAHGPALAADHRGAGAGPGVRLADGAGVRLRRRDGPRRLLLAVGEGSRRRRSVERLFALLHRGDRGADARPARVPLFVGGAEEPRVRRRGGGARGRRQSAAGRAQRQPADDDAGAALRGGARVLPGLRALRPAAGAGRSGRPPRARDVPVQAHEQARHAVLPSDGGGGGVHHRGDVSAGAAAALAAQDRRQVRVGEGQGDAAEAAAARRAGSGSRCCWWRCGSRSRSSCRSPASRCAPSSSSGARASSSPMC